MTDKSDLLVPLVDGVHSPVYDEAALTELYDQYAPKMYAYIYRRVGDAHIAEELTGDLFVRVLHAIRDGKPWRRSLRAWLYRIAHNLVVDHFRRRPLSGELALDLLEESLPIESGVDPANRDPANRMDDLDDRSRLAAALHQLTPEQQQVLSLRFGEGLRTRQVAEIMDKTAGAVEALQRRALASLQRLLGGES
ncbi:MAG: sigma-70 family RNA polymerase sigma factor [Anaerolineae bacterium]|nr:sigma-70 family RNA polymerase sigma factor [Anaerolineae bacterium]